VLLCALAAGCSGDSTPTAPSVPTYELTGRILDASALIAVPGVSVSPMDGPNAGTSVTTGADGRYTLDNLVGGNFTLRTQHSAYEDHLQDVRITSDTNVDIRLIPRRGVGSGWSGGTFEATAEGRRISSRVETAQVSQSGTSMNGTFTTADGGSGTFLGQLSGSQFTGSIRAEVVINTRRCRGSSGSVTGTATGESIALTAATMLFETCSGAALDVLLTLLP
jgi:hypothetical protein